MNSHPKHIYFVKPIGLPGPIKIGCSVLPIGRLRAHMLWSAVPLELAAECLDDGFHVERRLHVMFRSAHSHGEWFHPVPDLLALMARVAAGETVTDIIGPTIYPGPKRHGLTIGKVVNSQLIGAA